MKRVLVCVQVQGTGNYVETSMVQLQATTL